MKVTLQPKQETAYNYYNYRDPLKKLYCNRILMKGSPDIARKFKPNTALLFFNYNYFKDYLTVFA